MNRFFGSGRFGLAVIFLLVLAPFVQAQVPDEFTNVYALMQTDLTNFAATVDAGWNGEQSPVQFAAVLVPATDGGQGNASTNLNYLNQAVIPFLNGLTNLGVKTVKFSISFPTLYQPYYNSTNGANNPAGYTNMFNFYTNLVAQVRQRGLKIIIPSQNIFPFEQPSISTYYNSLNFTQYEAGRSLQIQTIARVLKPDYLLVQSEPITEVENLPASLGNQLNDPATDTNMIAGFLNDLQAAGLRSTNMIVGAGMGTWQPSFNTYLTNFVNLPMDIFDVHVYPVNDTTNSGVVQDFLARILQMADAAHAHGMKVGMGECWLQKESDSELANPPSQVVFQGRNTYSFWSPLDREFLLCMVKVGYWKQFEFIDPFWTDYFFAYLDYAQMQPIINGMSADAAAATLNKSENQATYSALLVNQQTNTGQAYAEYIQTGPPVLRLSPTNNAAIALGWTPTAVNFLLEQSTNLSAANWASWTIPPRAVGADYSASIATTNAVGFYRLHLP